MEIEFLGAARNVTGSMHLLHVNGSSILLECGLFQGRRQESFERNRSLPFDPSKIDAMVLSHAHIDHSGNIPNLVRAGYRGNIHCTHATRDLCSVMLRDCGHIMEADADYINKKHRRAGEPEIEPIYTVADAAASLRNFVSMDYERTTFLTPDVRLTFYDAGHILGSALVAMDIREGDRQRRLLFTGDLGRPGMPILQDPQPVHDVDLLITESTYGGRTHGTIQEAESRLGQVILDTHNRGGRVIIPAFSVGRTQEVVYALHRLRVAGQIPSIPIYVDSPLAVNATEVFRLHPEYYDSETQAFMRNHEDVFEFGELTYIRDVEESKALNERREPMVIISASGMCEAGRILHHLRNGITSERNTVLFVGFQAEDTLGRRIQEGRPEVSILGEMFRVRAHVESIDGYSAHADRNELLAYMRSIHPERIGHAYVVHGEAESALALQPALVELGIGEAIVPTLGQKVTV
jgi:metallo-beta-lactamase family protein